MDNHIEDYVELKPILEKAIFLFSQEGNTNGTTERDEELEITMETVSGGLDIDGGFFVLRSTTGWSINNSSELDELFDKIKNIKHD